MRIAGPTDELVREPKQKFRSPAVSPEDNPRAPQAILLHRTGLFAVLLH